MNNATTIQLVVSFVTVSGLFFMAFLVPKGVYYILLHGYVFAFVLVCGECVPHWEQCVQHWERLCFWIWDASVRSLSVMVPLFGWLWVNIPYQFVVLGLLFQRAWLCIGFWWGYRWSTIDYLKTIQKGSEILFFNCSSVYCKLLREKEIGLFVVWHQLFPY